VKLDQVILGVLVALIVLQVIESFAGEKFAAAYVIVLLLGAIIANRAALEKFASEFETMLTEGVKP
jgi:hypothetical protein